MTKHEDDTEEERHGHNEAVEPTRRAVDGIAHRPEALVGQGRPADGHDYKERDQKLGCGGNADGTVGNNAFAATAAVSMHYATFRKCMIPQASRPASAPDTQ
jgi:hypothetical protein